MRSRATHCYQSGFTLLEVLLTMAILVLIVGIMGSAFQFAVRSWEKGEVRVEEFRRTRIVMDLIAQQVKSFYPYSVQDEGERYIAFEGTAESLEFVSPQSLRHHLITGLKWVQYSVEEDEEGKALVVRESTVTGKDFLKSAEDDDTVEEPTGFTLLTGLANASFKYYVVTYDEEGEAVPEAEEEWVEAWSWKDAEEDEENRALEAIKITIEQKPIDEEDGEPITTAMTIPLVLAQSRQLSATARGGQYGGQPGRLPVGIEGRRPHDAPF